MNIIQTYQCKKTDKLDDLTLLTQFLSVLKLKRLNPNSKVIFYTDSETKKLYDEFDILKVYDEINTELLDNFDSSKINYDMFWATPKMSVMEVQTEPFVIVDVDMVIHLPLVENLGDKNLDIFFFHPETPAQYPFPTLISKPKGFEWSDDELIGFANTLPFNCAILGFNNIPFCKKYVKRYFEFVNNNKGTVIKTDELSYLHQYAPPVTADQWLLPAMVYLENFKPIGSNIDQYNIKTVSLSDSIATPFRFMHQMHNMGQDVIIQEMNKNVFHLWGAKTFYEKERYEAWDRIKKSVIESVMFEIEQNHPKTHFDILEKLEEYCRDIPKVTN